MLGNAVQEEIFGIVPAGLMTMPVRLWMLMCLAAHTRMEGGTTWAKDHAKAMDDHRTASAQGYALVTQEVHRQGTVGLLEVRINV